MADAVYFEPMRGSVFVTPGGSHKKLANHTIKRVAYTFVFPPGSSFYAKEDQMYGYIPEWGKIDVTLFRKPGKPTNETMKILFAAAPTGTDPKTSFVQGVPQGEYGGETQVKLVGTE
ncbi:hypothetical protein OESDEN_19954 [Oesophagostomum dentatum]|uniref:MSP domain protein n=1 Tax=Oesophagostomum dentatum TaxID=61180 RepID=A0A0B1SA03_OESDE|nr:hypothetical protein OESDEN_22574 [Oesophagostomum dentatum]KHJ80372.1 hypothetical protein OESDEN_19954 [Oesophagostomum dentatum]